ncbi:MAG: transcriptional regulator [Firmicutes bacterium]|nr:transcriptional regulator [Bacillota bacterium]
MNDFGKVLQQLRNDRQWSQRQLAYLSKVSNTEINRIESGKRQQPSLTTLQKLAEAFGMDLDELLNMAGVELSSLSASLEPKKPKDLLKILEQEQQLALNGEILSPEDLEIIKSAVEQGYYLAKKLNKRKKTE